jgi:plastocyanin
VAIIDIKRNPDGQVVFDPAVLQATSPDFVIWRNLDPRAQHWITGQGQPSDFWFAAPLAPFVNRQPADTTSELALTTAVAIVYVCSLHPEEQGNITFPPTS